MKVELTDEETLLLEMTAKEKTERKVEEILRQRTLAAEKADEAKRRVIIHDATLSNVMRQYREGADVSLRQLADYLGISAPYLSDMERGNRTYSEKYARRVLELEI